MGDFREKSFSIEISWQRWFLNLYQLDCMWRDQEYVKIKQKSLSSRSHSLQLTRAKEHVVWHSIRWADLEEEESRANPPHRRCSSPQAVFIDHSNIAHSCPVSFASLTASAAGLLDKGLTPTWASWISVLFLLELKSGNHWHVNKKQIHSFLKSLAYFL